MNQNNYMQVVREHMKSSYLLNEEKINAILPGFLKTLQDHLAHLEQQLKEGDPISIGVAGHTIKGALLNLGLFELADTAYTIEQHGKRQDMQADYPALVTHLKEHIILLTGE